MKRSDIVREFREFMAEPIPDMMAGYGNDDWHCVCQVFTIIKTPTVLTGNDEVSVDEVFSFPIAKVLQVGTLWKGVKCEAGDYVRLRDYDAMTMDNRALDVYKDSVERYKNGNMTPTSAPPTPTLTLLWKNHERKVFHPDPFHVQGDDGDKYPDIFCFDDGVVLKRVENIEIFLKS